MSMVQNNGKLKPAQNVFYPAINPSYKLIYLIGHELRLELIFQIHFKAQMGIGEYFFFVVGK